MQGCYSRTEFLEHVPQTLEIISELEELDIPDPYFLRRQSLMCPQRVIQQQLIRTLKFRCTRMSHAASFGCIGSITTDSAADSHAQEVNEARDVWYSAGEKSVNPTTPAIDVLHCADQLEEQLHIGEVHDQCISGSTFFPQSKTTPPQSHHEFITESPTINRSEPSTSSTLGKHAEQAETSHHDVVVKHVASLLGAETHVKAWPYSVEDDQLELDDWLYIDPQNVVQGPFSNAQMYYWYTRHYFPLTLRMKKVHEKDFSTLTELIRKFGRVPFLVTASPTKSIVA